VSRRAGPNCDMETAGKLSRRTGLDRDIETRKLPVADLSWDDLDRAPGPPRDVHAGRTLP
jgi:hypothetical protein